MRVIVLGALALAGCISSSSPSGGMPDGSPADLRKSPMDLSVARAQPDLSMPGDLALPPPDLAAAPGPHVLKAITAAGGGAVKAAGSNHSITVSVGQKTSGVAAGTAHQLQLGVLRGTQTK